MSATAAPSSSAAPAQPLTAPALAATLAVAFLAGRKAGPAVRGRLDSAPASQPPPPAEMAAGCARRVVLQPALSAARSHLDRAPRPQSALSRSVQAVGGSGKVPVVSPCQLVAPVRAPEGLPVQASAAPFHVVEDLEGMCSPVSAPTATSQMLLAPPLLVLPADMDDDLKLLTSPPDLGSGRPEPESWTSLPTAGDDDDEEELAPMTPLAVKASALPDRGCVLKASEGWQEVLPRRGPRRSTSLAPAIAPRPILAWLHGRCCRCFAPGHRAADCRDPLRCSRCLENGHRARGCRNPWCPLSSLACLAMPPVLGSMHRPALASCEGPMKSVLPSKTLRHGSWASVVSATVGSATPPDVMLQSVLADQTALLQNWLAQVGSFLERAEAALTKLSLAPVMSQTTPTSCPSGVEDVSSMEEGRQELYGCFSPRVGNGSSSLSGESVVMLETPVLQVMPELRELCLSPASPLSVEHLVVVSSAASCEGHVSSRSFVQPEMPESIVLAVPVVDEVVSVIPFVEDVDAASVLMPAPSCLLVDDNDTRKFNEFYEFLDKWVADQPTSGKTSGPLKKKPSKEKSKKNKNKKCDVIRKASVIS